MPKAKLGKSSKGKDMHYSVGALIEKDEKYLLIDRNVPPYGFACPAGHVDENETEEEAIKREVKEETGLTIESLRLIEEEELDWNWCGKGITVHHWYVFECKVNGNLNGNKSETKSVNWYSKDEIKKLKLEPSWGYWLKKLRII
jgi:ADP-ribose pyrophosphatase YjhB (NUDIX family)